MDYANKYVLAPMVRISILPMRLLCLDYGADLVYCEEIIDHKMLRSKRVINTELGTVDYIWVDGSVAFRTCEKEKDRVIFQIGTADAERALQVAQMVEEDVAGIDINMGCPKEFSIKGGMGAALLSNPDKIYDILTKLVQNIKKPVTCKIRILPQLEDTLKLVKMIASTGVKAIAIHGRTRDERQEQQNHDEIIAAIAAVSDVPIIANGGSDVICSYDDIKAFANSTNCTSVMVARAAMWNPSVFRKDGLLPLETVIKAFLRYAVMYDTPSPCAKYCVQRMLYQELESERGIALKAATSLAEICALWNVQYEATVSSIKLNQSCLPDGATVITGNVIVPAKSSDGGTSAKCVLFHKAKFLGLGAPVYLTSYDAKTKIFHCDVVIDGVHYTSAKGAKSKRLAERQSATVCLRALVNSLSNKNR